MPYETAIPVGGISIITMAIAKFKCIIKKNTQWTFGVACMVRPIIDDDEILVKQFDFRNVKRLYVLPKHTTAHNETSSDSE